MKLDIYRQNGCIRAHLTNIFLGIISSLLVWIGCEVQRRWRDEAYEQIELSLQETIAELDTIQEEEIQIRNRLEEYIDSPGKFRPENAVERQIVARFQEHLSEHQAGHNHISERKREEQFVAINLSIDELIRLTKELHKDPLLIDSCLIRLPIDSGEHATSKAIDELIHIGKITPSNGAHIRTLSNCLFGYSDKVLLEAQRIGSARVRTLSQTLNAVGKTVIGSSSQSLREIYSGYKKDQRAEQEQMLRHLIKSSLICLNFNDAYYFYDELLDLNPTAELHAEYGRLLQIQNEVSAAITHYKVALELFEYERTRPTQTIHRTRGQEADVQNNLAILLQKNNDLEAAQQYYHKALRSYRLLAEHKNRSYQGDIAMTFNNLGNLHMKLNTPQKALQYYQQALQLYTKLYEQDETTYTSHMATTLNNLAMTMKHTGQYSVAKAYYYQALGLKRKLAHLQPDVYLPNVALTLNNLATLYISRGDLQEAEARYQEALSIRRELSKKNRAAYLPLVANSLNNLATLMRQTNKALIARTYYEEAIDIYRELSHNESDVYKSSLAMTLSNLALLYAQEEEIEPAKRAYAEALKIRKDLAQKYPQACEIDYAQTLLIGEAILGNSAHRIEDIKNILDKYPENPKAKRLMKGLSIIQEKQEEE